MHKFHNFQREKFVQNIHKQSLQSKFDIRSHQNISGDGYSFSQPGMHIFPQKQLWTHLAALQNLNDFSHIFIRSIQWCLQFFQIFQNMRLKMKVSAFLRFLLAKWLGSVVIALKFPKIQSILLGYTPFPISSFEVLQETTSLLFSSKGFNLEGSTSKISRSTVDNSKDRPIQKVFFTK